MDDFTTDNRAGGNQHRLALLFSHAQSSHGKTGESDCQYAPACRTVPEGLPYKRLKWLCQTSHSPTNLLPGKCIIALNEGKIPAKIGFIRIIRKRRKRPAAILIAR